MISRPVITDTAKGSVILLGIDLENLYTTKAETDVDLIGILASVARAAIKKRRTISSKYRRPFGKSKGAYER